jgi:putative acetyltransferase
MVEVRTEVPEDYPAVHEAHVRAFGGDAEARLVELLRDRGNAAVALVAVVDGQIVGHIVFSPVTVAQAPDDCRAVGLGPMAVLPEFQNRGIGSQLVTEGLEACRRAGYAVAVVLGHTNYYPRFGFSRAKDHGLQSEYNAPNAFMVMELTKGMLQQIAGLVEYVAEFRGAGC